MEDNLKNQRSEDRRTQNMKLSRQEVNFRSPEVSKMDSKQHTETQEKKKEDRGQEENVEMKFKSPEVQNREDISLENSLGSEDQRTGGSTQRN